MRLRAVFEVLVLLAGFSTLGAGPGHVAGTGHALAFTFTFTVNSTADDDDGACQQPPGGDCTLREAIDASNATTVTKAPNLITFAIGSGVAVISENASLPTVTRSV